MPTLIASANSVSYNRRAVLISTVIGLVLSTGSYVGRLWARRLSGQGLQWDDWMMGFALPFSYMDASILFYQLTVGLGKHVANVTKPDLRKFHISLWVFQRGNPPCLFCIKTSILILYARIFPTRTFRKVCFSFWLYTICWAIAAFFSNMLQCLPISYFWDKTQPGACVPNALINIGMTNGVLSFVGDLAILSLPMPMVWKLRMDQRRKIALTGMFLLGGFVCITSIFRFIALAQINVKDITFTQVDPGVWTYIELAIGITSGNLPLLRPLFGNFFNTKSQNRSAPIYTNDYTNNNTRNLTSKTATLITRTEEFDRDGFRVMERGRNIVDVEGDAGSQGSEIELNDRKKVLRTKISGEREEGGTSSGEWSGKGIRVKKEVVVEQSTELEGEQKLFKGYTLGR